MSHFSFGHPWPIYFPSAFLALFLTLHSHVLVLTPLGFLGPITLSLILGAHGLAINPLLSLLALPWAYYGSFSLFYITYCPWVCHFSLSPSSFRPIYFLKAHFFILWACNPLFLPFWLNGFFCPFSNSFLPMLLGFFFLLDFPK